MLLCSAPRAADLLRDRLVEAGSLVPVRIDGSLVDHYLLHLVEQVVDCVDTRRSSQPKRATGEMKKTVLRPEALPVCLPAFRVPQFPVAVYWNGWAVELLTEVLGDDIEARPVWSDNPTLTPHPNPWGL
ncbi:hypothetical protein [Streptomyces sp. 8N616]|uniref:hypothetical protein n=1 Tax=Streptomyces sp. 8N616 TaxID=3457414 RepID=UPI003FD67645